MEVGALGSVTGVSKIAASVIAPLADHSVSVFCVSTNQEDYVLVSGKERLGFKFPSVYCVNWAVAISVDGVIYVRAFVNLVHGSDNGEILGDICHGSPIVTIVLWTHYTP